MKAEIELEQVEEFFEFLQGTLPDTIKMSRGHAPKLTAKKAWSIVWYLQEHLRILPDTFEKCDNCDALFDSQSSGIYWESRGKHFCGGCDYLVPQNYDRGKK